MDFPVSPTSPSYSLFTPKKLYLLLLVSAAGIINPLSSLMYTPALPAVASGLGVSVSKVNLTITVYLVFQGLMPCVWGSLGDACGRRLLYITTLTFTLGASIGLCFTDSFAVVLVLRALHATGCSATRALGVGLIRDITPPDTRGSAMGMYGAGATVGTTFGPVLGGIIAQYAGWHAIFYFLAALAAVVLIFIVLLLPETHRDIVGNGSVLPPKYLRPPIQWLCPLTVSPSPTDTLKTSHSPSLLQLKVEFIKSITIMKHPDVASGLLFSGVCYGVWQNTMVVTPTVYATQYGLDEVEIGLTFISNGVGCFIGNLITGKLLDYHYRMYAIREGGVGVEHGTWTHLRGLSKIEHSRMQPLFYDVPIHIVLLLGFGWILQTRTNIVVSIILAFFLGMIDSSILTVYSTLIIDLFPDLPATATASVNLVRCLFGAVGTSTINEMTAALGFGWSFTLQAGILLLVTPLVWVELHYGQRYRAKREQKKQGDNGAPGIQNSTSPIYDPMLVSGIHTAKEMDKVDMEKESR
ncbi:hypothetical protein VKT23_017831 [Stygiomarasmius scandens]|uniref:Major facilitator superfamily (MFS) profile domain-containing protein n=1 Tax=Marasmiellus scandens TaxID=2682957 RepID=A0ABR1IVD1_9AGAR